MKEAAGLSVFEYCRDRISAAFPEHNNNLPLAFLVPGKTAITAICLEVGGLDVAAEIRLRSTLLTSRYSRHQSRLSALSAHNEALHFSAFPQLVQQDDFRTGLGRGSEPARSCPLFVAEHGIGRQMKSFLQLLQRKQSGPFGRRGFKTQMKHPEEIGGGEAES